MQKVKVKVTVGTTQLAKCSLMSNVFGKSTITYITIIVVYFSV